MEYYNDRRPHSRSRRSHPGRILGRNHNGTFDDMINSGIHLKIAAALSNRWGALLTAIESFKDVWDSFRLDAQ